MRAGAVRGPVWLSVLALVAGCGGEETAPTPGDATVVDAGGGTTIGPAGGVILGAGVTLTVPPGALDAPVTITVTRTDEPIPPGYVGYSPVWRFAPAGLTFAVPVTVQMAFTGDATRAGLYWSRASGAGYERLASSVAGATVVGGVTHFSLGFVGAETSADAGPMDGGIAPDATAPDAVTDAPVTDAVDASTFDASAVDAQTVDVSIVDVPAPDVPAPDVPAGLAAPRPVAPLASVVVRSRRPTLRWALAAGADGARVELCRDRAMTASCVTFDAAGSAGTPASDLATGAWHWRLRGRAGGVTGAAASAVWSFRVGLVAGSSVGALPTLDVNGDGYADCAVGDPSSNAIHVYLGSTTGLAASPATTLAGAYADRFGALFSAAGDVNGDGYGDLLVSADGTARVFLGGASGLAATPAQTLGTTGVGPVAAAGDVDGDGYGDAVVGVGAAAAFYRGSAAGLVAGAAGPTCGAANCGALVAGAGDVNGDGYADVLVGAATRAQLHLGGAAGVTPAAARTLNDGSGGEFTNAGGLDDVNGDGFGDLFVNSSRSGTIVYHGGATGLGASPAVVLPVPDPAARFPYPARGGDVNGDGYADLVVANEYGARVFPGGSGGIQALPLSTSQARSARRATAGDFNGDGYADLATNAESGANTQVFHGSADGAVVAPTRVLSNPVPLGNWNGSVALLPSPATDAMIVRGVTPLLCQRGLGSICAHRPHTLDARFGTALALVGDLRGDGRTAVLLGDPGGASAHAVTLGDAFTQGVVVGSVQGPPGSSFGASVASAGDVNGDGRLDVVVGAPDAASAYVYLGGATFPGTPVTLTGTAGSHFGRLVVSARDLNGDGRSDLAVASDDRVEVFLGTATGVSSTPLATLTGAAGSRFGAALAGPGDLNGDGFRDLAVGAPGANAVHIFYGRSAGFPTAPSVTLTGAAGSEFGAALAGAGRFSVSGNSGLAVGAPGAGVVTVHGGASGPTSTATQSITRAGRVRFGAVVVHSGEANGASELVPGYLAVGAPGDEQPSVYAWMCSGSNPCFYDLQGPWNGPAPTYNNLSDFGAWVASQ